MYGDGRPDFRSAIAIVKILVNDLGDKAFYFPESALAHKYLDGKVGELSSLPIKAITKASSVDDYIGAIINYEIDQVITPERVYPPVTVAIVIQRFVLHNSVEYMLQSAGNLYKAWLKERNK